MKKTVNFRFGEEVHAALNELARISATPRTHILEGLVLAEHARVMGGGGSLKVTERLLAEAKGKK